MVVWGSRYIYTSNPKLTSIFEGQPVVVVDDSSVEKMLNFTG